jgi:hypothetical protein
MTSKPSTPAKILYRPVGMITSMLGGYLASMLFRQVWEHVRRGDHPHPPAPLESDYDLKEIVLAAVLQGAIFAGVRAVIDRQGARAFQRATGEWPGS